MYIIIICCSKFVQHICRGTNTHRKNLWILKPGFAVASFWQAVFFSILLSIINSIFERLTVKAQQPREETMKVFDKDGNRVA